jgi:hypothetical protein
LDAALDRLAAAGIIAEERTKSGGRPQTTYRLIAP